MTAAMLIYKIFRSEEWAELQNNGVTAGAPIDVADGYIHFSTAETVTTTAALYFADQEGLVLCALEAGMLSPLKWEPARDTLFPHLYRHLRLEDILWHAPLPLINGVHRFPDLT